MLRQLRSPKIKTVLWVGLAIFVIPSFVVFYGWGSGRGKNDLGISSAATLELKSLGKVEIDRGNFENAKRFLRGETMQYANTELSDKIERGDINPLVDYVASDRFLTLNEAINIALLREFSSEQGLRIDLNGAMNQIKEQLPQERQRREFLAMLEKQQGINAGDYFNRVAENNFLSAGQQTLGLRTRITVNEAWLEYSHRNEKFVANVARFNTSDYLSKVQDNEADLKQWFEKNAGDFTLPDQLEYEYLVLRKFDLRSSIVPSDDEITSYYNARKNDFKLPRLAKVNQILLTTAEDDDPSKTEELVGRLKDLKDRAARGEDFATLAANNTQESAFPPRDLKADPETTTTGGYLGFIKERDAQSWYGDEWTSAVFSLPAKGGLTDIIKTKKGVALVKAEEIREGIVPPLDQLTTDVKNKVIDEKLNSVFEEQVAELKSKAKNESTLDKLAAATSMTLQQTGKINKGADMIPGIGFLGDLKEAVADLSKGGRSDVLADQNMAAVMQVKEEYKAHVPSLEEVQDKVLIAWRNNKAAELARKDAETLKSKATDLATLEAGAAELGTTVTNTMEFKRAEAASGLGGDIKGFTELSRKFEKGAITLDTLGDNTKGQAPQGYVVWRLADIIYPTRSDFARELPRLTQELSNEKGAVIMREFLRDKRTALDKANKIKVNEEYR